MTVSGEISLDVQSLDEEGDDQDSTIDGKFEGTPTVEFPSDILASDDRDLVLADVEIEEADVNFSVSVNGKSVVSRLWGNFELLSWGIYATANH